jgi:hypothetical protein
MGSARLHQNTGMMRFPVGAGLERQAGPHRLPYWFERYVNTDIRRW